MIPGEVLLVRHELTTVLLHEAGIGAVDLGPNLQAVHPSSVAEAEAVRRILLALIAAGVEQRPSDNIQITDGGSISNRGLLDRLDNYIMENS